MPKHKQKVALFIALLFMSTTCQGQVRPSKAGSPDELQQIADYRTQLAAQQVALGELSVSGLQDGARGRPTWIDAKVMQVIDDNRMLVGIEDSRTGTSRYSIWVMVKAPTKGITDGKFWRGGEWRGITGSDILKVNGTTTYNTAAGGTKTVFVIEPVTKKELDELAEKAKAAAEAAQYRKWTLGEKTVVAKLLDVKNNMVRLQAKEDGELVEFRMIELNKEDQRWAREELRRRTEDKQRSTTKKPVAR